MFEATLLPGLTKPASGSGRCRAVRDTRSQARAAVSRGSCRSVVGQARSPGLPVEDRLREEGGRRVLVTSTALRGAEIAELARLSRNGGLHEGPIEVRFRVATPDRRLAAIVEPSAAPPALRMASLRNARRAGLVAGLVVAPLIPGVTAHEGDLVSLLAEARTSGASFVRAEVRFLDPVRTADLLRTLRRHYPRVAARLEVWLRTASRPPGEERSRIEARVEELARRFGLPRRHPCDAEPPASPPCFDPQQHFSFRI
jgi:DNA repair photolyase